MKKFRVLNSGCRLPYKKKVQFLVFFCFYSKFYFRWFCVVWFFFWLNNILKFSLLIFFEFSLTVSFDKISLNASIFFNLLQLNLLAFYLAFLLDNFFFPLILFLAFVLNCFLEAINSNQNCF